MVTPNKILEEIPLLFPLNILWFIHMISGALCTTPTVALKKILDLPPLNLYRRGVMLRLAGVSRRLDNGVNQTLVT